MTLDTEIAQLEAIVDAPRRLRALRARQLNGAQRTDRQERLAAAIALDPEYPAKLEAAEAEHLEAKAKVAAIEARIAARHAAKVAARLAKLGKPGDAGRRVVVTMVSAASSITGGRGGDAPADLVAARAVESAAFSLVLRLKRWAQDAPYATPGGKSLADGAKHASMGMGTSAETLGLRAAAAARIRERFDRIRTGDPDAA